MAQKRQRPNRPEEEGLIKENEVANVILDSEKADAIIKARLATFPRVGGTGNHSWTNAELELRDGIIWEYITINCMSRENTSKQIAARWDISLPTARKYVAQAIEHLAKNYDETEEQARQEMIDKATTIVEKCMEEERFSEAQKAMDMINKLKGLYTDKKDVKVEGDIEITFDFQ